ncbi:uncharacterized protein LOC126672006 [Mercurialis annua]|uniref:uncharacterized protein LOC126672006 n=1 Tax=Mercurialis annua TaxID=3986 RepID=UPI00215EB4D1|nr:uncharacterized protein LOC126672006 [Mercurialis annua]XP_050221848.1 uncharacterized protein LOC126672006 [Mercurialis annua]
MSMSHHLADDYEEKLSGEESKDGIRMQIDMQDHSENASLLPAVHPDEEKGVAREVNFTCDTITEPNDNQVPLLNHIPSETQMEILLYRQKMTKSSLVIIVISFFALSRVWFYHDNHPLSNQSQILWDVAVGSSIIGFISAVSSILMFRHTTEIALLILNTIAYGGAAFAFIASMRMFSSPTGLDLFFFFLAFAVCLPVLTAGFC